MGAVSSLYAQGTPGTFSLLEARLRVKGLLRRLIQVYGQETVESRIRHAEVPADLQRVKDSLLTLVSGMTGPSSGSISLPRMGPSSGVAGSVGPTTPRMPGSAPRLSPSGTWK